MELARPVSMDSEGGVSSKIPICIGDSYHSKMYHKCEAPAEILQTTSDPVSPYMMSADWNQTVTRDRSSASSIYNFLWYQGMHGAHQIRQNKLQPRDSTDALKIWLNKHKKNPYPSKGEKIMLAILSNMTLTQVSTWFANARRRLKKDYSSDIHRFGLVTEISIQAKSEVAGIIPLVPEKLQYFTSIQES